TPSPTITFSLPIRQPPMSNEYPDDRRERRARDDNDLPRRRRYQRDDYPAADTSAPFSVLGLFSLIQGIGSLVASFIPCIGARALCGGAGGALLGGIGAVVARNSGGRQGTGLPIAGCIINLLAMLIGGAWLAFMAFVIQKGKDVGPPVDPGPGIEITAVDL